MGGPPAVTLAAARPRGPETVLPDPVETLLRQVIAEQAQQRDMLSAILRLLERGRGAREQGDVALLVVIAEIFRDRQFTSGHVIAHTAADVALRDALEAVDITNAQELGCVFRRMEGDAMAGLRLARVANSRAGVLWQVQVCEA
jgi:hypothetical protein